LYFLDNFHCNILICFVFSVVSSWNFLDVCCNFQECLKLLAEVFLITNMNTVIGKYIKGLDIFLSYLTWNALNIMWLLVINSFKIPSRIFQNSMTILLMTQNSTKITNTIFMPQNGECTIMHFLFYYYTTFSTCINLENLSFVVPRLLD
jgi:hypothetical protein